VHRDVQNILHMNDVMFVILHIMPCLLLKMVLLAPLLHYDLKLPVKK